MWTSYCGGLGFIPGHCMWNFWWTGDTGTDFLFPSNSVFSCNSQSTNAAYSYLPSTLEYILPIENVVK
jgi:hypothetical protein